MRLAIVLIFGLCASVLRAQTQEASRIWIDKNEVWLETAGKPQQLTHDGIPKRLAVLAPTGNRLVYVVDDWSSDAQHKDQLQEVVTELSNHGRLLRHIVPKGYVPKQFDGLEWIDSHRVGAMTCGHANCMYWILDPDSGKTLNVMNGGFDFVWSHNRRWVARRMVGFLDLPDRDELDGLMLNETSVYPPRAGVAQDAKPRVAYKLIYGHRFGPFSWSPHDVWLAFTDTVSPEGDPYVVLVSPTGAILRETVPVDVEWDAKIEWTDETHLQLINGGRTFRFAVDGPELREITTSEDSADSPN